MVLEWRPLLSTKNPWLYSFPSQSEQVSVHKYCCLYILFYNSLLYMYFFMVFWCTFMYQLYVMGGIFLANSQSPGPPNVAVTLSPSVLEVYVWSLMWKTPLLASMASSIAVGIESFYKRKGITRSLPIDIFAIIFPLDRVAPHFLVNLLLRFA